MHEAPGGAENEREVAGEHGAWQGRRQGGAGDGLWPQRAGPLALQATGAGPGRTGKVTPVPVVQEAALTRTGSTPGEQEHEERRDSGKSRSCCERRMRAVTVASN